MHVGIWSRSAGFITPPKLQGGRTSQVLMTFHYFSGKYNDDSVVVNLPARGEYSEGEHSSGASQRRDRVHDLPDPADR